jgi:hypothetical protein
VPEHFFFQIPIFCQTIVISEFDPFSTFPLGYQHQTPFDPVSYTLTEILREHDVFSRKMSDRINHAASALREAPSSSSLERPSSSFDIHHPSTSNVL